MIEAKFKDIYGTQIKTAMSVSGYFRMDLEGKNFPPEDDGLGNKIGQCLSLDMNEARVLLACLNSYFKDIED